MNYEVEGAKDNILREDKEKMFLNRVHLVGIISKEFSYSHRSIRDVYVKGMVEVPRRSGKTDSIPIIATESCLTKNSYIGQYADIYGRFCSFGKTSETGERTVERYVFVSKMDLTKTALELDYPLGTNEVTIEGKIRNTPSYRTTLYGQRTISEFTIETSRKMNPNRADNVPCIAWSGAAIELSELGRGSSIEISGRLQSRDYIKRFINGDEPKEEKRTAYEVSISEFSVLSKESEGFASYEYDGAIAT